MAYPMVHLGVYPMFYPMVHLGVYLTLETR